MEFLYVVAPLPSWQHRDSCVVDTFATQFLPSIYVPFLEPFTLERCCILSVVIGEFGGVPLRENVSGILMLPRAGRHQLVHGPESKCSWKMYLP